MFICVECIALAHLAVAVVCIGTLCYFDRQLRFLITHDDNTRFEAFERVFFVFKRFTRYRKKTLLTVTCFSSQRRRLLIL